MNKEEKEMLKKIYDSVIVTESILKKVFRKELCKHLQVDKKPIHQATTVSQRGVEYFSVHRCLDCGAQITMKLGKNGLKK